MQCCHNVTVSKHYKSHNTCLTMQTVCQFVIGRDWVLRVESGMRCWECEDELLERDAVGAHDFDGQTRDPIGLVDCQRRRSGKRRSKHFEVSTEKQTSVQRGASLSWEAHATGMREESERVVPAEHTQAAQVLFAILFGNICKIFVSVALTCTKSMGQLWEHEHMQWTNAVLVSCSRTLHVETFPTFYRWLWRKSMVRQGRNECNATKTVFQCWNSRRKWVW